MIKDNLEDRCWVFETVLTDRLKRQGKEIDGSTIPTYEEDAQCTKCNGYNFSCKTYATRIEDS